MLYIGHVSNLYYPYTVTMFPEKGRIISFRYVVSTMNFQIFYIPKENNAGHSSVLVQGETV
jgi:hypothetical protein